MHPDVFRAVSDPTRRGILDRLAAGECSAGELARGASMSAPAISQHLAVLRQAGLVRDRRRGRHRLYRLEPERLRDVFDWVSHYQRFWEARLDQLEHLLDEEG